MITRLRAAVSLGGGTGAVLVMLVLAWLSGCKTMAATYEVARQGAIPAAAAVVVASTGGGPVLVGVAAMAADITGQAVDGQVIQSEFKDAARERVIETMIPPTASVVWSIWKWAIIAAFLASWWFPTPRALWLWGIARLQARRERKTPPPDP